MRVLRITETRRLAHMLARSRSAGAIVRCYALAGARESRGFAARSSSANHRVPGSRSNTFYSAYACTLSSSSYLRQRCSISCGLYK